ncbi:hypothetical protein K040078D81_59690 [Blautia hominis]|uniref:SHOCT domain-containing protein n=1 Tax=Blautia hominis TaxID=2025493 RepID=A0ABQ0BK70_9FIRM
MGNIEELEKYKKLLDDGVLSEQEFRTLKQKLLGLKTDEEKEFERQQEREKALAEIEQMKAEQEANAEEYQAVKEQKAKEEAEGLDREAQEIEAGCAEESVQAGQKRESKYQQTYEIEKAKEQARLEAIREAELKLQQEKRGKIQSTAKGAASLGIKILLWFITVFFALMVISCFSIHYFLTGIVSLLIGIMACPIISAKCKEISQLQPVLKYKKIVVIVLVILWMVSISTNA